LGLLAAWLVVLRGDPTGQLPVFVLARTDIAAGIALMVLMGLLAGIAPAMGAMRLRITDALRRT
jgi:ABC-type lipoprotein release transport system permease subunit